MLLRKPCLSVKAIHPLLSSSPSPSRPTPRQHAHPAPPCTTAARRRAGLVLGHPRGGRAPPGPAGRLPRDGGRVRRVRRQRDPVCAPLRPGEGDLRSSVGGGGAWSDIRPLSRDSVCLPACLSTSNSRLGSVQVQVMRIQPHAHRHTRPRPLCRPWLPAQVIAVEISPARLAMARHNAAIYGVEDKIEFICAGGWVSGWVSGWVGGGPAAYFGLWVCPESPASHQWLPLPALDPSEAFLNHPTPNHPNPRLLPAGPHPGSGRRLPLTPLGRPPLPLQRHL